MQNPDEPLARVSIDATGFVRSILGSSVFRLGESVEVNTVRGRARCERVAKLFRVEFQSIGKSFAPGLMLGT